MTVDKDFAVRVHLHEVVHLLDNLEHLLEAGDLQVLPVSVEVRNSIAHQDFRVVGKPYLIVNDSVAATRVLARLLQIENCAHVRFLKLFHNVELLDFGVREARRSNQPVRNQVAVQSLDEGLRAAGPVLNAAILAKAKGADKAPSVLEIRSDDNCVLLPVVRFLLWKDLLLVWGAQSVDRVPI
jgi:hypothetical protein